MTSSKQKNNEHSERSSLHSHFTLTDLHFCTDKKREERKLKDTAWPFVRSFVGALDRLVDKRLSNLCSMPETLVGQLIGSGQDRESTCMSERDPCSLENCSIVSPSVGDGSLIFTRRERERNLCANERTVIFVSC